MVVGQDLSLSNVIMTKEDQLEQSLLYHMLSSFVIMTYDKLWCSLRAGLSVPFIYNDALRMMTSQPDKSLGI